jgi:phosphatidylglycerol lysyltransferase
VSNVPGGIGVLETVLSLLLRDQIPSEQVVASMIVFRLLLHILPLMIALPVGTIHLLMTPRQQPAA